MMMRADIQKNELSIGMAYLIKLQFQTIIHAWPVPLEYDLQSNYFIKHYWRIVF